MTPSETAGKQFSVVLDDLVPTFQVLAGNRDEVSVLRKQGAKSLDVATIDSLNEICNHFSDGLFFGVPLPVGEIGQDKQRGKS